MRTSTSAGPTLACGVVIVFGLIAARTPLTATVPESHRYRIIDLGTLGGLFASAESINDHGEVAGYSGTPGAERAFLWNPVSGMENLGTLGGPDSEAFGINASGQVVGWSWTANFEQHAFLWDRNGGMRDLGTLGGSTSFAEGINARGQVVGSSYTTDGRLHPFLWDPDLGMVDLAASEGFDDGTASDVNARGQVVGSIFVTRWPGFGFLWDRRMGWQNITGTPQADPEGIGINARGQVVGYYLGGSNRFPFPVAFLWDERDGFRTLADDAIAYSINARGQVVGWRASAGAFVWEAATGLRDLGTLPGFTFSSAYDINARGQIVGTCVGTNYSHACLWDQAVE